VVDEEFVEALTLWQAGSGKPGILEHPTLLLMAPKLVEQLRIAAPARDFYNNPEYVDEEGKTQKKTEKNGGGPAGCNQYAAIQKSYGAESSKSEASPNLDEENAPPADEAEAQRRDHEPFATILSELGLSAAEAFENIKALEDYKGQPVDVTNLLIERALVWQIEAKLGLTLDGQLGPSALVYMGLKVEGAAYAIWNVNNLEGGETDTTLNTQLEGYKGSDKKDIQVVSVDGTDKKLGDVTGDDGVAFGLGHMTKHRKLGRFIQFIDERWKQQESGETVKDEERLASNPLQVHFGAGATYTSVNATLGIDLKDKDPKKDNAYLLQWRDTPDPLGGKAHLLDRFLGFMADADVQRLQVPYFNEKVKNDSDNPLIKAIGNSSNPDIVLAAIAALKDAMAKGEGVKDAELALGNAYIAQECEDEGPAYKVVAELAWKRAYESQSLGGMSEKEFWKDVVKGAKEGTRPKLDVNADPGSGPEHRLERLLSYIRVHGSK